MLQHQLLLCCLIYSNAHLGHEIQWWSHFAREPPIIYHQAEYEVSRIWGSRGGRVHTTTGLSGSHLKKRRIHKHLLTCKTCSKFIAKRFYFKSKEWPKRKMLNILAMLLVPLVFPQSKGLEIGPQFIHKGQYLIHQGWATPGWPATPIPNTTDLCKQRLSTMASKGPHVLHNSSIPALWVSVMRNRFGTGV